MGMANENVTPTDEIHKMGMGMDKMSTCPSMDVAQKDCMKLHILT